MNASSTPTDNRAVILAAARELLERDGIEPLTMQDVAKRCRLGRATLYRYYATKEQLIVSLTLEWGRDFQRRLEQSPPRGRTAGQCIEKLMRRLLQEALDHPRLIHATLVSLLSNDPIAVSLQKDVATLLPDLFRPYLGRQATDNDASLIAAAHALVLGTLFGLVSQRQTMDESLPPLVIALERLFGKKLWGSRPAA